MWYPALLFVSLTSSLAVVFLCLTYRALGPHGDPFYPLEVRLTPHRGEGVTITTSRGLAAEAVPSVVKEELLRVLREVDRLCRNPENS